MPAGSGQSRKEEKLELSRLLKVQLIEFPSPISLTHLWSLGSCLGLFLASQVLSGILISTNYISEVGSAFGSVLTLANEAYYGFDVYYLHSAGAGLVFALTYAHMTKWITIRSMAIYAIISGWLILLLLIIGSFLGYVLLWQQMSFWAATVITSLVSILPYGVEILVDLWGGFVIDQSTLTRFYSFHYLVTIIIAALAIIHLLLLHLLGSGSSQNLLVNIESNAFGRYYFIKDVIMLSLLALGLYGIVFILPTIFSDVELYTAINTMSTPPHIVPEWYLLVYYAMLRGIPSKVMGSSVVVLGLVSYASCVQTVII